jgi:hypothetical protein
MDLFDFFDMAREIMGFLKAVGETINNKLHQREVKRGHFANREADGGWTPDELSNAYEPWDFLSEEQWKEILRGDKPLDAFTTSHVWPPDKEEIEALAMKQEVEAESMEQENTQEQNEDSGSAETSEPDDSISSDMDPGDFSSDDYGSGDSGSYGGYIG